METHKFMVGDYVSWQNGKWKSFGHVVEISDEKANIIVKSEFFEEQVVVACSELTFVPTITITDAELQRFCRFEISLEKLLQGNIDSEFIIHGKYQIRAEDLLSAIRNFRNMKISETDFAKQWFWPIRDRFYDVIGIDKAANFFEEASTWDGVPNEETVFSYVWNALDEGYVWKTPIDFDMLSQEIEIWQANKEKPVMERAFTFHQKMACLSFWDKRDLSVADAWVKNLYRKLSDEFCEEAPAIILKMNSPECKNPDADIYNFLVGVMRNRAYACYDTNHAIYEHDWYQAQEGLLQLLALTSAGASSDAYKLGCIYYEGYCNNGTPEYDKAFKYFSISAADANDEACLRLADMFYYGYGIRQNKGISTGLVFRTYYHLLKKVYNGEFDNSFAEAALRMGLIEEAGRSGCLPQYDEAYYYYLQARYAIRKRMTSSKQHNSEIAERIEKAIQGVLPKTHFEKKKMAIHYTSLSRLLASGIKKRRHMRMMLKKGEQDIEATFWIVPFEDERNKPKLFVTVPEAAFSGMLDTLTIIVKSKSAAEIKSEMKMDYIAELEYSPERMKKADNLNRKVLESKPVYIDFDDIDGRTFSFYGKEVATLVGDYVLNEPLKEQEI